MNTAANLAVGLAVLFLAVTAAAQQQPQKQSQKQPMDKAIKLANVAGVYIGIMENCKADTTAIRAHYRARIAKTAGDGRDKALALFEGTITRSAAQARDVPGACEKTRAASWTEFQKVIDNLIDGKGRF